MTGGRLKHAAKHLDDEPFCLTYGDGVGDVDIRGSIAYHRDHGKKVTMTVFQPDERFGVINLQPDNNVVTSFREKQKGKGIWANAGFFVLDRDVIDYIDGDQTSWEIEPMRKLAEEGEVIANRHTSFWMPMDTLRDKNVLEKMWAEGNPPWKCWD